MSEHPHDSGHTHGGEHAHAAGQGADSERRIRLIFFLTASFMLIEAAGGLLSGSLALLADAGHMLSDVGALGLAWYGFRVARRPPDALRSYGYHRFPILAAYTNGIALFAIAAWIIIEAIGRFREPVAVLGGPMLAVAVAGLAINLAGYFFLHRGDRQDLNVRAALVHVIGDLLGSVAAIAAAVVILATGWTPIDPLLSVLVALLVLRSAWDVVRRSSHVLMEGAPEGFADSALAEDLKRAVPGIADVHHVHAWMLAPGRPIATLHVRLSPGADAQAVSVAVRRRLHDRHGIDHATVQIEGDQCHDSGQV